MQEQIKAFNADELQIAELTRNLKRYEAEYQNYAEHLEQARIDQALEAERISNISIIQPATFEPKPVRTKSLLVAGCLLLLGLSLAVGLPLLLESRHRTTNDAQLVGDFPKHSVLSPTPRRVSEQLAGHPS